MTDKRQKGSVIGDSCFREDSAFQYAEDHPMKLVLLNGLRRKQELCDEILLRQLLSNKGFQMNEYDNYTKLLEKIRLNLTVFTVSDLHNVLKVPKPPKPVVPEPPQLPVGGIPHLTTHSTGPPTLTMVPSSDTVHNNLQNQLQNGNQTPATAFKFVLPAMNMDGSFTQNGHQMPTEVTIYQTAPNPGTQNSTRHNTLTSDLGLGPDQMNTSVQYRRPTSQESDHYNIEIPNIPCSTVPVIGNQVDTRRSIVEEVSELMKERRTTEDDLNELIQNLENMKNNIGDSSQSSEISRN